MARLNYNHLRYFWIVAREGHLTRAAAQLGLSQSALSSQIKKLEEQLGHALFERDGRGLALTEAGRRALDYADTIFAAGEELLGVLSEQSQFTRRRLRVGALATLSRNFQIAFLGPALARDDVVVSLTSGSLAELMAQLDAHRLDLVLANQAPLREGGGDWIAHRLAEQPVSVVGAPEQVAPWRGPGRAPGAKDLEGLLTHAPLILPSSQSGVRSAFDALAMRLALRLQVLCEVDDMAMMRVLARENVGLAVLPPIVVRDELQSGQLVEAATLPGIAETFYAITPQRRFPDPIVSDLLSAADGAL